MKKWEELSLAENLDKKHDIIRWIANWLKPYTQAVINRVLVKRDEILSNDVALNLLKELYERETKETKDFEFSIEFLLDDFEKFSEYDPHNHCLTHSGSYRDILYDWFISDSKRKEE